MERSGTESEMDRTRVELDLSSIVPNHNFIRFGPGAIKAELDMIRIGSGIARTGSKLPLDDYD